MKTPPCTFARPSYDGDSFRCGRGYREIERNVKVEAEPRMCEGAVRDEVVYIDLKN
jgi:hypothetical protein